jgi:regulator of protease activity HflC (stomatin/prohibitin superfamily)
MFRERVLHPFAGLPAVLFLIVSIVALVAGLIWAITLQSVLLIVVSALLLVVVLVSLGGLVVVQPNEAAVITLFGRYVGTIRESGLWWVNPFTSNRKMSLRVRNLETAKLKVNDANSNPVEIGAIVVWKVTDTAEACFEVEDFERYVNVQSEAALRTLASMYPYDAHEEGAEALSTHQAEVSAGLQDALVERFAKAGVTVVEARISHLAYAQEIAAAMLQRQQAGAIVAARRLIVEGAVGMVESALELLAKREIVELDAERKAAMVSNLLVVLCSDRAASPVINAGSLHT